MWLEIRKVNIVQILLILSMFTIKEIILEISHLLKNVFNR